MLGIMHVKEAIAKAKAAGLDLIEISPNAVPPVCKILDYGKFKYENDKKANEARKKQKVIEIKELKMSLNIGIHDYQFKLNHAKKFLEAGNKVKFSLFFKGREITHPEIARELFERIKSDLSDISKVDQDIKMEGRQMILILASVS